MQQPSQSSLPETTYNPLSVSLDVFEEGVLETENLSTSKRAKCDPATRSPKEVLFFSPWRQKSRFN